MPTECKKSAYIEQNLIAVKIFESAFEFKLAIYIINTVNHILHLIYVKYVNLR